MHPKEAIAKLALEAKFDDFDPKWSFAITSKNKCNQPAEIVC